jgi:hypothetical protein
MVPDIDPDIGSDPISGHQDTIQDIKYPISGSISPSIIKINIGFCIPISVSSDGMYLLLNRSDIRFNY